uniref:Uncharacterized protein n=1 Tax=viral metagenome TaxID=1070528 RepID=A0A6C0CQC8_9ZZZZ
MLALVMHVFTMNVRSVGIIASAKETDEYPLIV